MNENNLYYKRGTYIIDKLLKIFNNDSTFYKKRDDLLKSEIQRIHTNKEIVFKDYSSFFITSLTALLGINKENIERINKHNNYDMEYINNKNKEDENLIAVKNYFKEFELDRNLVTNYDDWLSVENCDYPTLDYLMNIRNGLMHSEYEPLDKHGYIISVNNSNYTHFKSKVLLPGFINFCLFYFGNSSFTGISEKFNIYELEKQQATNDEELLEKLKDLNIMEVNYENITSNYEKVIPELKLYKLIIKEKYKNNKSLDKKTLLRKTFNKNYNYTINEKKLDDNQIFLVKKMIEKYYGDEFYNLDIKSQNSQISTITRYLIDSRSVISEWICDYIIFFQDVQKVYNITRREENFDINDLNIGPSNEEGLRSVFACRTALLIVKLYHILYRLQNKKYEEVDYNKINFDFLANDYNYERKESNCPAINNFELDKAKLKLNEQTLTDKEAEYKVICEIIRDALSHGNIEMNFKVENGEIVEYIVFHDIYHSKSRKIEMTLDKLENFLKSEAFETQNCLIKESGSKSL